jgi:ribosomal protein S18 acetylase RimI-like enzyme
VSEALHIRLAIDADAPALAAFGAKTFLETFGHLYPPEDKEFFLGQRFSLERTLQDIRDPARVMTMVYRGDDLVAFLDCGPLTLPVESPESDALELYRLYLDETQKGTGLAHRLMDMALNWARDKQASALYLGVWSQNERAKRLYAKYGFEIVGAYHFKVGNTLDDERIMRLGL